MEKNRMQAHKWNIADTITSIRIGASVLLLLFPLHSIAFFVAYTLTGITDVLDGWIARKTGTASDFGARLDSIADLLFYGIVLLRLIPYLWQLLPLEIWYFVMAILLIRLAAYGTAAIKYHRFASLHTWMNKLTGMSVFLLPYFLVCTIGVVYSWVVCALAFLSSLEELLIHLIHRSYNADTKSILQK
ncbi:MAG: CDP-alcohol phosphatidyltransferase family protein [Erysipelotrichaceae bacterium]|nr:CDP-alcohol phosphatidyltransferase family protein [Erysipelotrichaceae bacterium]